LERRSVVLSKIDPACTLIQFQEFPEAVSQHLVCDYPRSDPTAVLLFRELAEARVRRQGAAEGHRMVDMVLTELEQQPLRATAASTKFFSNCLAAAEQLKLLNEREKNVILSAAGTSRSEVSAESKDPYPVSRPQSRRRILPVQPVSLARSSSVTASPSATMPNFPIPSPESLERCPRAAW
jgi:hypothetical protein